VATVTTFGSADSHDEHFFNDPAAMITGKVDDPTLNLNNKDIRCASSLVPSESLQTILAFSEVES